MVTNLVIILSHVISLHFVFCGMFHLFARAEFKALLLLQSKLFKFFVLLAADFITEIYMHMSLASFPGSPMHKSLGMKLACHMTVFNLLCMGHS